jgi:UDPglucose--hexose-1-phosphate uridylyltransferase
MSELRYHPFLEQWVITATHRQDRTFFPPDDYCPLCPTHPGGFPTEIPVAAYDIAVFENKFPSLRTPTREPDVPGSHLMPVRPSDGVCEVVCFTSQHDGSFAQLPLQQVRKLVRVWQHRYLDLGSRPEIDYVSIFENKGKEIGVTLSHPHGQIYGYPFVPPILVQELRAERTHFDAHGRPLMGDLLDEEFADGRRIVWENEHFVVLVPFFARYPYEVYVTTKTHRRSIGVMSPAELDSLAEALLGLTRAYDQLFGFSMPYIMAMHQEPTVPGYEFAWFHVEFYPPYRTANKLKYLAGSEAGAGAFINDTLPEVTAATLRDLMKA